MKQQERPINYWEFSDEEKLSLFEEIKENPDISFEEVARQLYPVDQKHEFSFISKMLHTINTSRPIYDSQVNAALKLRTYQPDFEKRLKKDKEILDRISDQYRILMSSPEVIELQEEIDLKIAPKTISTEKKLDFILWALGDK